MKRNGKGWKRLFLYVVATVCPCVWGQYGGGRGTADDPYLIETAEQLNAIAGNEADWDKCFRLTADLDLGGYTGDSFRIIGRDWKGEFAGTFDGNGKTISHFTYACTGASCVGLFGNVSDDAVIRNLTLVAPKIDAPSGQYVGALAGICRGTLTGCSVRDAIVSGDQHVGGLVGAARYLADGNATGAVTGTADVAGLAGYIWEKVERCSATADVTGSAHVGGLVGWNNGTISASFAAGAVSGKTDVGGLVGLDDAAIIDCYSVAGVTGQEQVGGLVGGTSWPFTITNCYSSGKVVGRLDVGGLVGVDEARSVGIADAVRASFWDIEASAQATSDGGTGLETVSMQCGDTFEAAGWDLAGETANGSSDIWYLGWRQGYPRLSWQSTTADGVSTRAVAVSDDFEDDCVTPLWQVYRMPSADDHVQEIHGRFELNAFDGPGGCAFYVSDGWTLDPAKDFALKVDYHFTDTMGEAYVVLRLTPDPNNPFTEYLDVGAGCVDEGAVYISQQMVGGCWQRQWGGREGDSGTLYLSYDAEKDELYRSFTGYGAEKAWRTSTGMLQNTWTGKPLHVALGGISGGTALTSGASWLDNFAVEIGDVLR